MDETDIIPCTLGCLWRVTRNKEQGKETLQIENYRITGKGGIKLKSDKNCQEKGLGVREESGRVNERRKNMDLLIRSSLEKEKTDKMDKKRQRCVKLISG